MSDVCVCTLTMLVLRSGGLWKKKANLLVSAFKRISSRIVCEMDFLSLKGTVCT